MPLDAGGARQGLHDRVLHDGARRAPLQLAPRLAHRAARRHVAHALCSAVDVRVIFFSAKRVTFENLIDKMIQMLLIAVSHCIEIDSIEKSFYNLFNVSIKRWRMNLHDAADVRARVQRAQHAREVAQRQRGLRARPAARQPQRARHQRDLPARAHHLAHLHHALTLFT